LCKKERKRVCVCACVVCVMVALLKDCNRERETLEGSNVEETEAIACLPGWSPEDVDDGGHQRRPCPAHPLLPPRLGEASPMLPGPPPHLPALSLPIHPPPDLCAAGNVPCPSTSCQAPRTCIRANGTCSAPTPLANGTLCPDGSCLGGVCTGGPSEVQGGLARCCGMGGTVPCNVLAPPTAIKRCHVGFPLRLQTSASPAASSAHRPPSVKQRGPAARPRGPAALPRRSPMARRARAGLARAVPAGVSEGGEGEGEGEGARFGRGAF
jgi:hypothetical protein